MPLQIFQHLSPSSLPSLVSSYKMATVELMAATGVGVCWYGSQIYFIMLIFLDILRYIWFQIGFVFEILRPKEKPFHCFNLPLQ